MVLDAEAPWNVVALIAAGFGLLALGRWAFRSREGNQFALSPDQATEFLARQVFAPEAALGPVRITKFYFSEFDLTSGPPDPQVFYDELFVELYDADSGHRWMQSYGVATPQGLAKILQDKSWSYLFANGIIVVQKYDLTRIREAVVARLAENNELFEPANKPEEEAL